jgi:hypothetical protein
MKEICLSLMVRENVSKTSEGKILMKNLWPILPFDGGEKIKMGFAPFWRKGVVEV